MSGLPEGPECDETTTLVVDACAEVHRRLGPGLSVDVYLEAISHELSRRGTPFQRKVPLPVFYRGVRLDAVQRLDLCVARAVAVDVRIVDALLPLHRAELRAKLRVSGLPGGVLVNFRTARFGEGLVIIRRSAARARERMASQLALLDAETSLGRPIAAVVPVGMER